MKEIKIPNLIQFRSKLRQISSAANQHNKPNISNNKPRSYRFEIIFLKSKEEKEKFNYKI